MILLGAGSSVPFGIPAMKRFVELFKEKISDKPVLLRLFEDIETALSNSKNTVGYSITFDLESLMVVLQDLASDMSKPISFPTFAFMLGSVAKSDYNIKSLRSIFGNDAEELLGNLQYFIFEKCFEPIRKGLKRKDLRFLDFFYRPLFALINRRIFSQEISWTFTTNWDPCLKQWLEYSQIAFEDGTLQDAKRKTVLNPHAGWTVNAGTSKCPKIVPLHGSFDLIYSTRLVFNKSYVEIEKVNNPEKYFMGNPSEIAHAFIVYPIEAVGYAQTIRSPYLDMLTRLKSTLLGENEIYVVGFSFRDSIIASVFDEVVRERLESQYPSDMKVVLIDTNPDAVVENLHRQGYTNIANAIAKVQVTFPETLNYENKSKIMEDITIMLKKISARMDKLNIAYGRQQVNNELRRYAIEI